MFKLKEINEGFPAPPARVVKRMMDEQLIARGISDKRVLEAMRQIPRHLFVDDAFYNRAYDDCPLPIGDKQTISQPYMVATMSELLELEGTEKVLEIGTGSGYQTAVLAALAGQVYSVERIPDLAHKAQERLEFLGYDNVHIKVDDGCLGWEEFQPYGAILVAASSPRIPESLIEQLKEGGRLVLPVGGDFSQSLQVVRKVNGQAEITDNGNCVFVKLIGEGAWEN
ncbi:MAG: protein-L-isoaspartate(D-aspartate) O-methyltransferase [bacterium]